MSSWGESPWVRKLSAQMHFREKVSEIVQKHGKGKCSGVSGGDIRADRARCVLCSHRHQSQDGGSRSGFTCVPLEGAIHRAVTCMTHFVQKPPVFCGKKAEAGDRLAAAVIMMSTRPGLGPGD